MLHEAISRAVAERQPALLAFLEKIVNMDSPTEDRALTTLVGDVLQTKAESLGMTCERDPQTVYADNRICRLYPEGLGNAPRILLVGHFDTVYEAGTVARRPFRVEGNRILGPGTFDMKAGLSIGLFALEALQAVLPSLPVNVTFIFNSDEEIGSPASRKVIVEEAKRHDLALILEPGEDGPSLVVERKGVAIFHLDVEGREAHAGIEPEKGLNSITEVAHKTLAIQALSNPELGTTVTPGVISGGTKPYVVPGRTRLSVDCRVTSMEEQARVTAGIEAAAAKSWVAGTRTTLTGGFHRPPMVASERTWQYIARMQAIAQDAGFPLLGAKTGGASDGNLTAAAGTPTIDGVGVHGGRAHSEDEFVDLPSVEAKCRVLAQFLASLAERPL